MKQTLVLLSLVASAGWAATREGSSVTVPAGEQIAEDLYVAGGTITIEGDVDGDVVAVGGELRITGDVSGDVLWLGGRTKISGRVGGSVRAVAGQLGIEGAVADDVMFAGGELTLGRLSQVGRDVFGAVGSGRMLGAIARDVRGYGGRIEADGPIGGALTGEVGQLTLGEHAQIQSDVKVASEREFERAPGARVEGRIERLPPTQARPGAELGAIAWLRSLVGLLAAAALWLMLFPGFSRRAMATLRAQPSQSFGLGFLALLAAPIGAGVVFAVGVLVGGWWISAVLMGVALIAAVIAAPLVGHFVGVMVLGAFKREGTEAVRQVVGLVVLSLLAAIPLFGGLVMFATACAGVGAQLLALKGRLPVRTSERLDTLRDPLPERPEEIGSPS